MAVKARNSANQPGGGLPGANQVGSRVLVLQAGRQLVGVGGEQVAHGPHLRRHESLSRAVADCGSVDDRTIQVETKARDFCVGRTAIRGQGIR